MGNSNLAKPKREFTTEEVREIRALYYAGLSQTKIAKKFACSQSTVSKIVKFKRQARVL